MATKTAFSTAGGMDWNEIDWTARTWTVAAERMKAHNRHVTPLSRQLYALLREWWVVDGKPASGPITAALTDPGKSLDVSVFSTAISSLDMGFTPHDFRRTVSTHLVGMECPADIRKALRAHVDKGDIAAVYEHHDMLRQKTEWLQKWADHLDTLGFAKLANKQKADRLQIELVEN